MPPIPQRREDFEQQVKFVLPRIAVLAILAIHTLVLAGECLDTAGERPFSRRPPCWGVPGRTRVLAAVLVAFVTRRGTLPSVSRRCWFVHACPGVIWVPFDGGCLLCRSAGCHKLANRSLPLLELLSLSAVSIIHLPLPSSPLHYHSSAIVTCLLCAAFAPCRSQLGR